MNPKRLPALAAFAIPILALPLLSGPGAFRAEASGSDSGAFRSRLAAYIGELEAVLPLVDAVAGGGGAAAGVGERMELAAHQCRVARQRLAATPTPSEEEMWIDLESLLAPQTEMWSYPAALRDALEREIVRRDGGSTLDTTSSHDDCPGGLPSALTVGTKIALALFEGIVDIIPDPFVRTKIAFVAIVFVFKTLDAIFDAVVDERSDCVQEKVFAVLDKLDVMDEKLDAIQSGLDSMERLQIEDDLARAGSGRIGVLELPETLSVGDVRGKLDKVRGVVVDTLRVFKNSGQLHRRSDARESFLRGEYWREQGQYIEAYTQYRSAYQAGVGE